MFEFKLLNLKQWLRHFGLTLSSMFLFDIFRKYMRWLIILTFYYSLSLSHSFFPFFYLSFFLSLSLSHTHTHIHIQCWLTRRLGKRTFYINALFLLLSNLSFFNEWLQVIRAHIQRSPWMIEMLLAEQLEKINSHVVRNIAPPASKKITHAKYLLSIFYPL